MALTYLRNQLQGSRMDHSALVKQRLCGSGMKWKERGAAAALSVRALTYTAGQWSQFWGKIDRHGFPVAA